MSEPDIPFKPHTEPPEMPVGYTTYYDVSVGPGVDPSLYTNFDYDLSSYRIEDHQIKARDAVWGFETFSHEQGDDALLELAVHDVVARLQAIEQLTSPVLMTTIAGMSGMPRWDHAWGTVILAKRFSRMLGLSPEESHKKQVRALLSDASHWAYSHLGDWMLQGMGGPEDEHDQSQHRFLTAVGVGELVTRHGLDLDEILVASDCAPWEECPKPDLNIDNLDYIPRQAIRMFGGVPGFAEVIQKFPFEVNADGNIVVTNVKTARMLTKAAMLLPTEHWQEPTHRFNLTILQEMIRHDIVRYGPRTMQFFYDGQGLNPRDALMSVDSDYDASFMTSSPFLWALHDVTKQVGAERRLIYRTTRQELLNDFVADRQPMDIPDPMVPAEAHAWKHSLFPANLEVIQVKSVDEVADFKDNPHTVDFFLPRLKARWIDPLVRLPDGTEGRLSESEGNQDIAELLAKQAEILSRDYVARLLVNPDFKRIIETNMAENQQYWDEQLKNPRMDDATFARAFGDVASLAKAGRKTQIEWWR